MTSRSKYTDEFKANAVRQFLELKAAGKTIPEIEKELGVTNSALYTWTAQAKEQSRRATTATMLPATVATKAPAKTAGGRFPEEVKQQALQMLASGVRQKDVARQMKIKVATIGYWAKTMKPERLPAPAQAKPVNGIGSGGELTDVLIYLRQAEKEIMDMVRDGKIVRPDQAHLLTLLALGSLQKSVNRK